MGGEPVIDSFQQQVADLLLRHRSFLDVTSKFQESNARVNRALMKSVTECGCIEVQATLQSFPDNKSVSQWKEQCKSHLDGKMCDHCIDVVQAEMGKNLFYLVAICNLLEIDLKEVFQQESTKLSTLGVFNLR